MPSKIIKTFANKSGESIEKVEKYWKKSKKIVKKEYDKTKDSKGFYPLVVGTLKNMLKLEDKEFTFEENVDIYTNMIFIEKNGEKT